MGQIHSSPPETNPRSKTNPCSKTTPVAENGGPGDDAEDWVLLEKCTCGETRYATSDTASFPGRESKDVTLTSEQTNHFLPIEVPQSLVPVEYNLTAEVPVSTGNEDPAQSRTDENTDIRELLFQGATWSYLGIRWITPPVPGAVEDMVATLQSGMGM